MSMTTTLGALIGGAIDAADGDDSAADGALIGAIVANVLKVTVPLAIVGGAGFYAWRKARGWLAQREMTA